MVLLLLPLLMMSGDWGDRGESGVEVMTSSTEEVGDEGPP